MNLLDRAIFRLAQWRATSGGSFKVSQTPPGWVDSFVGAETTSGALVSEETALNASAVFACVRILAETLAALPLTLFEQLERGREKATNHPLYHLLHDMPNPEMSSLEWRETMMGHLGLWGNAYSEIEFDGRGRVTALWPLRPDRMDVSREGGNIVYTYRLSRPDSRGRTEVPLLPEQVFHIRGLGFDGVVGYSPVGLARQSIGLTLATEEFGARFFGNGARPGGWLEHPGKLSDDAYKRLRDSWEKRHRGLEAASRVGVLEEGMKYHEVGIPPDDAQFLQTRTFQLREIARWYRVPPHMIADLERATFSNIEHQSIEFVQFTMLPWFVRWEQAIHRSLLLPAERDRLFAKFIVAGLLRGDAASRYQAYSIGRQNGWLSANDIRELEEMNPIDGGDVYLIPLNMIPANEAGSYDYSTEPSAAEEEPEEDEEERAAERRALDVEQRASRAAVSRHRLANSYRRMFRDTAARIVRREVQDVGNAARRMLGKRDSSSFLSWLEGFYGPDHQQFVARQMTPLYHSYGDLVADAVQDEVNANLTRGQRDQGLTRDLERFIEQYVRDFAQRHSGVSVGRLRDRLMRAIAAGEDPLEAIEDELGGWEEGRSEETSRWETTRFNNAIAVASYAALGVAFTQWMSFGENCPYCSSLNGRTMRLGDSYIGAETDFSPEGAERPLRPSFDVGHPPAHAGCDCMVVGA